MTKLPKVKSGRTATGAALALVTFAAIAAALWGGEIPNPLSEWQLRRLPPTARFDTLFDRAMAASRQADTVALTRLSSAAIGVIRLLPDADSDRRFHAAMLAFYLGDDSTARRLTDGMLERRPGHLLALMMRFKLAQRAGDRAAADRSLADFLARHQAELAADLPEYRDHREAINGFLGGLSGGVPHWAGAAPQ